MGCNSSPRRFAPRRCACALGRRDVAGALGGRGFAPGGLGREFGLSGWPGSSGWGSKLRARAGSLAGVRSGNSTESSPAARITGSFGRGRRAAPPVRLLDGAAQCRRDTRAAVNVSVSLAGDCRAGFPPRRVRRRQSPVAHASEFLQGAERPHRPATLRATRCEASRAG